jgi:hypothetical protein
MVIKISTRKKMIRNMQHGSLGQGGKRYENFVRGHRAGWPIERNPDIKRYASRRILCIKKIGVGITSVLT